jgi:hypothetical protein
MTTVHKASRAAPGRRWGVLVLSGGLLALAGCEGFGRPASDPLLTGGRSPQQLAVAPPVGGAGANPAVADRPPLPATYSQGSTAAIAAGTGTTPADNAGLRIGSGPATMTSLPSAGAARGLAPTGPVLGGPQPVPESTSRLTPIAAPAPGGIARPAPPAPGGFTPVSLSGSLTYEQMQQMLKDRGVTDQVLRTVGPDQWQFYCTIPNRENHLIRRVIDVKAGDPLAAIRAGIAKIDEENR